MLILILVWILILIMFNANEPFGVSKAYCLLCKVLDRVMVSALCKHYTLWLWLWPQINTFKLSW